MATSRAQAGSGRPIEVLVTGADWRSGLAVARSLARHGVSFVAICESADMAFRSRHVRNALISPSAVTDPEAFVDFVRAVVEKHAIQLVIPVTDPCVVALNRYRGDIEKHARLAIADSEALHRVIDKRENLRLARRLGVPCPKQFELRNLGQIPEMIDTLGFPIVLKPPGPSTDPRLPSFPFRVLYARDERELRAYIDEHCSGGAFPMFQECAIGTIHNLCCFAARGDVRAIHEYHSVRRCDGAGVLREVVEPLPEAERSAREMLRALEWDGVAHVGFFVSEDRRRMWYMETNARFWGSVQGSIHAGWDFPFWVYQYFQHGKEPEPGRLRMGSRTCWHRGDLESLLTYLRGGEVPATGTHPGKIRAIVQYLSGFNPAIHSDVFAWTDPLPAIVEHWRLTQKLWASARGKLARSAMARRFRLWWWLVARSAIIRRLRALFSHS